MTFKPQRRNAPKDLLLPRGTPGSLLWYSLSCFYMSISRRFYDNSVRVFGTMSSYAITSSDWL